jgi:hypothetical protein
VGVEPAVPTKTTSRSMRPIIPEALRRAGYGSTST